MRRLLPVLFCFATLAVVGTADAASEPQSKLRAERNLIGAEKMLARWKVGLVNPWTRLIRTNVWVRCVGRGAAVAGRYTKFGCTVGYRRVRVTLTYLVLNRKGFEVRNRRITVTP
jgi:hypothetical protein